jgi:hypothetical protein
MLTTTLSPAIACQGALTRAGCGLPRRHPAAGEHTAGLPRHCQPLHVGNCVSLPSGAASLLLRRKRERLAGQPAHASSGRDASVVAGGALALAMRVRRRSSSGRDVCCSSKGAVTRSLAETPAPARTSSAVWEPTPSRRDLVCWVMNPRADGKLSAGRTGRGRLLDRRAGRAAGPAHGWTGRSRWRGGREA